MTIICYQGVKGSGMTFASLLMALEQQKLTGEQLVSKYDLDGKKGIYTQEEFVRDIKRLNHKCKCNKNAP